MRAATVIGIILIILGVVALAYQGISYTTEEEVGELGGIEITAENRETFPLPPILGIIALVGGILLVAVGRH